MLQGVDQGLGSGDVGGKGDVVNVAEAQKAGLIRLAKMGVGVPKEHKQVNFVAGNTGANLLVAPL